jgi:hypothetical protein
MNFIYLSTVKFIFRNTMDSIFHTMVKFIFHTIAIPTCHLQEQYEQLLQSFQQ